MGVIQSGRMLPVEFLEAVCWANFGYSSFYADGQNDK